MNTEQQTPPPVVLSTALLNMRVGVPYIVTHDSVVKEFQCGGRICLCADGTIYNIDAAGWMGAADVPEATRAMAVRIDTERLEKQRAKLATKLAGLHV
tara:strand:+ start:1388 stop:1681 length:294 start_codon:yes stop_codon:yes gene_type:complete